jgi:hypothetical protein
MLFATRFFPAAAWAVVTSSGGMSGQGRQIVQRYCGDDANKIGELRFSIAAARERLSSVRARWKALSTATKIADMT